jgi:hypothetical protein
VQWQVANQNGRAIDANFGHISSVYTIHSAKELSGRGIVTDLNENEPLGNVGIAISSMKSIPSSK